VFLGKKWLGFCPGGPASFFTEFLLSRQANVKNLIFVFNMEENEIFCLFPHFVPLHGEACGYPAAIITSPYPKIYEVVYLYVGPISVPGLQIRQIFGPPGSVIICTDVDPALGPHFFINKPKN
jgi:hypothetical protein